jgi:hypothetical protein
MRIEVQSLLDLGPFPDSQNSSVEQVESYEKLLKNLSSPVTNDEACKLIKMFGSDEYFGLSWTLIHLIESAPSWPIESCLERDNPWVNLLKTRINNSSQA